MPLYSSIPGRFAVYWLSQIGEGAGPLILSWFNEICSADTEKRALIVAMSNDLAYVVQAVVRERPRLDRLFHLLTDFFQAPNFVWKTTAFPAAHAGYTWCIVLQVLLSMCSRRGRSVF